MYEGCDGDERLRLMREELAGFTKTANCWGISNLGKGTNSNRVVVFGRG